MYAREITSSFLQEQCVSSAYLAKGLGIGDHG